MVKEGLPYDPGKTKEYGFINETKGTDLLTCLPPISKNKINDLMVNFQKSPRI